MEAIELQHCEHVWLLITCNIHWSVCCGSGLPGRQCQLTWRLAGLHRSMRLFYSVAQLYSGNVASGQTTNTCDGVMGVHAICTSMCLAYFDLKSPAGTAIVAAPQDYCAAGKIWTTVTDLIFPELCTQLPCANSPSNIVRTSIADHC